MGIGSPEKEYGMRHRETGRTTLRQGSRVDSTQKDTTRTRCLQMRFKMPVFDTVRAWSDWSDTRLCVCMF